MPELPEVETIKRGLAKAIIGKEISDFTCDWHKALNRPLRSYKKILCGLKIKTISRRAKTLILTLSNDWRIMVHLKMTGQLVFQDKNRCLIGGHPIEKSCENLPNKFTHVIFKFSDGSHLYFNDIRKFGWVRLYTKEELEAVLTRMNLGPEPLGKDFTLKALRQAMARRPKSKIKQFIMAPENVVGVGNIYSDEVCYYAKVRPDRLVNTLKRKDVKKIHDGIIKILNAAIKAQGTTFSNYVNAAGEAGAYVRKLKVYQRYGQKCYTCHGEIKRQRLGGRTSSFCPGCQK